MESAQGPKVVPFQLYFSFIFVQIAELKRGAEIIVCTPGRMIDMLTANNGKYNDVSACYSFTSNVLFFYIL